MQSSDFAIPLLVSNPSGQTPRKFPVEIGVPFPEAMVMDPAQIGLERDGVTTPVDVTRLMSWPDGSVRWALLRFIAQHPSYVICPAKNHEVGDAIELQVRHEPSAVTVNTGVAQFLIASGTLRVSCETPDFFTEIALTDAKKRLYRFAVDSVECQHQGKVAAILHIKGRLTRKKNKEFCRGECRLWFWAGTAFIRCEFTLWNPRAAKHPGGVWDLGDPGSIFFRSLNFNFVFREPGRKISRIQLNPDEAPAAETAGALSIWQRSSGGKNWQSLTHVDRHNQPTTRFCGYQLHTDNDVREGKRCTPVLLYTLANSRCAFALENFWQAFPNRMEADSGIVALEPFPATANQKFELQGGEKVTVRWQADFACADEARPLPYAQADIVPTLPRTWYEQAGFMPGYTLPGTATPEWLEKLVYTGINGPNSFFDRREAFDEYGWRNFGDTPADHEKLHYSGNREFISHYNNQYDMLLGFLGRFAATGDERCFALGQDLARHIVDHDLYSTNKDKAAYNGGYFWHTAHYMHAGTATHRCYSRRATEDGALPGDFGGGPGNEHDYASGLALYYLLTGDVRAKAAVLQLAAWVRDMQDPWRTPFRFLSRNLTGLAISTRQMDYLGPGRGGAYSINTCLDAFLLTTSREWLDLAESYMRFCIHPALAPETLNLLDREEKWSYVVFLQVLGRYLDLKRDWRERDDNYHYARVALLRFARWMAENEYPYLDRPEELEYPTSTWAAQEMRKSSVFRYAAKYAETVEESRTFGAKADFFAERSGDYMNNFTDAASSRNLALLMSFTTMNPPFPSSYVCEAVQEPSGAFGEPRSFIPQKLDAMRKFRRIVRSAGIALIPELIDYIKDSRQHRKSVAGEIH